jgi:hypothetical protein
MTPVDVVPRALQAPELQSSEVQALPEPIDRLTP